MGGAISRLDAVSGPRFRQQENTTAAPTRQEERPRRTNVSLQKRRQNCRELEAGNITSCPGSRCRFEKARTIQQQERNNGRTETQTKDHNHMEEGSGQEGIAARERWVLGVRMLHRFLHRGKKTRIEHRQNSIYEKHALQDQRSVQRRRLKLEHPHSSDAKDNTQESQEQLGCDPAEEVSKEEKRHRA